MAGAYARQSVGNRPAFLAACQGRQHMDSCSCSGKSKCVIRPSCPASSSSLASWGLRTRAGSSRALGEAVTRLRAWAYDSIQTAAVSLAVQRHSVSERRIHLRFIGDRQPQLLLAPGPLGHRGEQLVDLLLRQPAPPQRRLCHGLTLAFLPLGLLHRETSGLLGLLLGALSLLLGPPLVPLRPADAGLLLPLFAQAFGLFRLPGSAPSPPAPYAAAPPPSPAAGVGPRAAPSPLPGAGASAHAGSGPRTTSATSTTVLA
ncbi:hypothetical protein SMICM304S_09007 [Streptomyces microflavus]